jgi:hypothetical protein
MRIFTALLALLLLRMNLALPFSLLQEAMERLDRHAFGKG